MNNEEKIRIVEETQAMVEQMRLDDIEEQPETEFELFSCDACAKDKPKAGSIMYGDNILCNDCVLIAEIGFALGKIDSINDVIEALEDRKLEELCNYVKQEETRVNN